MTVFHGPKTKTSFGQLPSVEKKRLPVDDADMKNLTEVQALRGCRTSPRGGELDLGN
jgi:hypothetical protein